MTTALPLRRPIGRAATEPTRVGALGTKVLIAGNGLRGVRVDAPLMDSGEEVDAARLWDEADGPLL